MSKSKEKREALVAFLLLSVNNRHRQTHSGFSGMRIGKEKWS